MPLHYHMDGPSDSRYAPIVILHGLFGSLENLGLVARALFPHCKVISVDLPNHGRSGHDNVFTYRRMAQKVMTLLDKLDVQRFNLLGHSMGGKVAMQMAIDNPERVEKLVVADIAPVQYPRRHNQIIHSLKTLDLSAIDNRRQADEQLKPGIPETGVRSFLLKSLAKDDNGYHWRFNLDTIAEQYDNIVKGLDSDGVYQGPTLFIKGGDSDYIDRSHRAQIQRHFPNSKAHVIPDTGHWLHAEKPEAFNRIVHRFLFDPGN